MTYSIYHLFVDLCKKKQEFFSEKKLESFPFDEQMFSCVGDGKFPDLAIKLNNDNEQFTGGELIELKESKNKYSVASFNSTIPTGEKDVRTLTEGKTNTTAHRCKKQVTIYFPCLFVKFFIYFAAGNNQM